jgi:hypothetical protein
VKTLRCSRGPDSRGRGSRRKHGSGSGDDDHLAGPAGKALGRVKTRRASGLCTTLNPWCRDAASRWEQSPGGGPPTRSRGVMNLDDGGSRGARLLASARRARQRQEGSGSRKRDRITGRSKALKVAIPGAARPEMVGRREGEQGVKRARTLKTHRAGGVGIPGKNGSFVLATAVGSETP